MQAPTLINKTVRVQSIRSQSEKTFGGAIFFGYVINDSGQVLDAKETIVVKAPYSILHGIQIEQGQWWEIYGETETYVKEINGYRIKEVQILPHEMQLTRPSGEHIVRLMADSKEFQFIGEVKARQLWEKFGEELYAHLDTKNITKLREVVSLKTAYSIVNGWEKYADTKTLLWLVQNGFSVAMGKKLLAFYGKELTYKIEEDPYRLLAFMGKWGTVDAIALNKFKIKKNDPRRLKGAIEESLYRRLNQGDTAVPLRTAQNLFRKLLKTTDDNWAQVITEAMIQSYQSGCYVINNYDKDIFLHALGPYVMEKTIAVNISHRLNENLVATDEKQIKQIIHQFENSIGYQLNEKQISAVISSTSNNFSLITGGAGTGKTTVLEAIYKVFDERDIEVHQMALSGRAAKRMQETTGREATTIAGFLKNIKTEEFNENTIVVIDEASMLDVATMYRILRHIPAKTKILLSGDPAQLPPIGAGMVLHDIINSQRCPVTELTIINRYGGNIAHTANSIRDGFLPDLPDSLAEDICFISCETKDIKENLVRLYEELHQTYDDIQILEPVKSGKYCGTQHTNQLCQEKFAKNSPKIKLWNDEFDQFETLKIKESEPVICTKNFWDKGLQNGSLGTVIKSYEEPQELFNDKNESMGMAYADIEWDDGVLRPLTDDMLDDISLAYSITTHKAQGSQWSVIVIPVYKARNLDRSMLYTAVTRAKSKVILLGDIEEAKTVVKNPPKAFERSTALKELILSEKN